MNPTQGSVLLRGILLAVVSIALTGIVAAQPLNGTYTIGGASPSYPSFTAAVNALVANGVNGAVTFNVRAGTYTEHIDIPSISGSSGTNTITFASESGTASGVTLTYSATATDSNYVIRLKGADYIRIKNMTLSSGGLSSSYRNVIRVDGTGNSVGDILIQGNILTGYPGYSSSSDLALINELSGSNTSGFTIYANTLNSGSYAIYMLGNGSTYGTGTVVRANTINNSSGYGGIAMWYQVGPVIDSNMVNVTADGINLTSCSNPSGTAQVIVTRNRIVNSNGGTALTLSSCAGNSLYYGLVANNFISILGSNYGYGMNLSSASYQNVYYNSVNVTSPSVSGIAFYQSAGSNLNIVDNVFMNPGGGYAYYVGTPGAIATSDYNDYYTTGSNLAYWGGTTCATIAALQAANSTDANSFYFNVAFVSQTDLHLRGSSIGNRLMMGTPVAGVTTDIDGNLRSGTKPYMGANEGALALSVDGKGIVTKNGLEVAPQEYQLLQNYPNPFNPTSEVKFSVAAAGRTTIELFDILGAHVATLFDQATEPGQYYRVTIDGTKMASGAYFYVLKSANHSFVKRMLLLK